MLTVHYNKYLSLLSLLSLSPSLAKVKHADHMLYKIQIL